VSEHCHDRASDVVNTVITALKDVYGPGLDCPPLGGTTTTVRFFAGDGAPIEEIHCDSPLLWVRLMSRHRSVDFPEPDLIASPCGAMDVIVLEVGVARCADMDPTASVRAGEAEIALDDTWRISKAMCLVSSRLKNDHLVGTDVIEPYGPEGGVIAWTSTLYVSV
jgi:hypothetical protein